MADVESWFPCIAIFSSLLKLLFLHSYRSTDFDVHRNWLAITYSLPIHKWYYEDTSIWTLDYPPLFAWFEYVMSQVAVFVDPKMVRISKKPYISDGTIIFQRISVIVTDLVFIYAVKEFCSYLHKAKKVSFPSTNVIILALLLVFNFGLLIVDHIHFQYNGFLFGLLLLSITRLSEGKNLEGAFLFAILLNFKHIFLYIAPAYFIFLLRSYCFSSSDENPVKRGWLLGVSLWHFSPIRLFKLGFFVIAAFGMSFGPFIAMGQLGQVLSRLFPFKRGLCHSYWAPNIWALYNVLDKAAFIIGRKLHLITSISPTASMTGGLVKETKHLVLPSIPPLITFILTLLSILPAIVGIWYRPRGPTGFLQCLVLCAYGSFLFGWHVHEKAILMVIIPLCLLAVQNKSHARVFLVLSTAGHLSMFPLLFRLQEAPIKVCLMMMYTILAFYSLCLIHCGKSSTTSTLKDIFTLPIVTSYEAVYICGLAVLEFYNSIIHPFTPLANSFPFLPLMMYSVYCSLGIVWSWMLFYKNFLSYGGYSEVKLVRQQPPVNAKRKKK